MERKYFVLGQVYRENVVGPVLGSIPIRINSGLIRS